MSRTLLAQEGADLGFNALEAIAVENSLPAEAGFFGALSQIILVLFEIVAVFALSAIVFGGLMYILSLGNDQRTATAKRIIYYAIVGLIIAGLTFVIVQFVGSIFVEGGGVGGGGGPGGGPGGVGDYGCIGGVPDGNCVPPEFSDNCVSDCSG